MTKQDSTRISEHVVVENTTNVVNNTTVVEETKVTNNNNETRRAYEAMQRTKDMRMQVTSFAVMIFLTFIAFALVAGGMNKEFVIPALIVMAVIQVAMQFYYFMHMNQKGHGIAKVFMLSGAYLAAAFVITALYIVWIGDPIK